MQPAWAIPNGIGFVLGGEPNPANPDSNSSLLVPPGAPGPDFVFTCHRSNLASYLNPSVEFGTSPDGPWTTAVDPGNSTISVVPGSSSARVTVAVPKGANPKIFARLTVSRFP